jgi:hypothetical protein
MGLSSPADPFRRKMYKTSGLEQLPDRRQKDAEDMSNPKVVVLNENEALSLGKDAKIVAFRWDLVPWCLVLDLDSPVEEGANAPLRRSWMIFVGMSELSWSVEAARLPNGVFMTNALMVSEIPNDFHQYVLPLLAPKFGVQGDMADNPHNRMSLKAKRLVGAISTATACFGEHGPDRKQRDALATDEDLLGAIGDVWSDNA